MKKNRIRFRTFEETFHRDIRGNKKMELLFLVEKTKLKIAEKLIELREKQGLTQAEMAEKMGVSQQQISQIESGSDNVTLETITKFLSVLHVIFKIKTEETKSKKIHEVMQFV